MYFSHVTHVIIDEVDTMLTQGFGSDIRAILRSAVKRHTDKGSDKGELSDNNVSGNPALALAPAQLIMSTATLTKGASPYFAHTI